MRNIFFILLLLISVEVKAQLPSTPCPPGMTSMQTDTVTLEFPVGHFCDVIIHYCYNPDLSEEPKFYIRYIEFLDKSCLQSIGSSPISPAMLLEILKILIGDHPERYSPCACGEQLNHPELRCWTASMEIASCFMDVEFPNVGNGMEAYSIGCNNSAYCVRFYHFCYDYSTIPPIMVITETPPYQYMDCSLINPVIPPGAVIIHSCYPVCF